MLKEKRAIIAGRSRRARASWHGAPPGATIVPASEGGRGGGSR